MLQPRRIVFAIIVMMCARFGMSLNWVGWIVINVADAEKCNNGRILLKNSVFGQLGAFHRKTIPLAHHSENVVCQRRAHKTLVLISGSVFPAGEFFNRIGGNRTFAGGALPKPQERKSCHSIKLLQSFNWSTEKNKIRYVRPKSAGQYRIDPGPTIYHRQGRISRGVKC